MSTAVRHVLGAVFGVVLTLLTWIGLGWASQRITMDFQANFALVLRPTVLLAIVLLLVIAAGLGLATSARFASPIAALIPGVVFLVLGMASMLAPAQTKFLSDISPLGVGSATFSLSMQGVYPLLGVLLIVSAIPPHRWRAARPVQRRYADHMPAAPAAVNGPGTFPGAPYPGAPAGPGAYGTPAGRQGAAPPPGGPHAARPEADRPGGARPTDEPPRPPDAPPAV